MAWLETFFGNNKPKDTITSVLDLVIRTAEFASNPDDIDHMLDNIRRITSELSAGQSLSPKDEKAVLEVYLQIERYLTTKEPIRNFTKAELRARCSQALKDKLNQYETAQTTSVSATHQ